MKKILLGVFIFLVGTTFAQDKRLSFSNGYVNSGKFKVTKSVTEGDSYIDVTYNFTGAYMYDQVENGKTYARIDMPDAQVLDIKGEPALPYYNDLLAISSEKNVSVKVVSSSYKEYSASAVLPAVGPYLANSKKPAVSESKVYTTNSFYPAFTTQVEGVNTYRSLPYASVAVYPIQINPVTKKARCYSKITYRLTYDSKDGLKSLKSKKESLESFKEILSNPKAIDNLKDESSDLRVSYSSYDYVIVTTNTYTAAAKKLADWKTMLGYRCTTVVKSSWTETEVLNSVRNIYKSQSILPDYLLILGDHQDVPGVKTTLSSTTFYSDNPYSRVKDTESNGSGHYASDVATGRISPENATQANLIVDKIINYEKNPPTSSAFYNRVLDFAYFQDNGNDGKEDMNFTQSAEDIRNNLISKSYTVDRYYVHDNNSTCPRTGYTNITLPNELLNCSSVWNRNISEAVSAINNGRVFAYYRGHGSKTGLASVGFTNTQVQNLSNGNKLPIFFNFTCSTGMFWSGAQNSPCFTESLLRKSGGGAVGSYGNAESVYTTPSTNLSKTLMSRLFTESNRAIGKMLCSSLIAISANEYMHKIAHYFGDPSMHPWTDFPTCFSPTITKEGSNIRVKTGGVSGCKVTICRISDMAILATRTMSGSEDLFNVGSAPCYVTITKHNYIPYIGVARDLYLQNMSFTEDRTIHGVNVTAGKNVTSDLSQGNVYVRSGKTTLLATSSLKLKTGFIVRSGAKFVGKKQSRSCNYSTSAPRSLRSADVDLEYDDEEYEIDPEITDIDDAVSDANGIEIYPNPTDGLLYIRSNNTINKVIVTDLTGKVILDVIGGSDEVEIDLSSNAQGMYLLNVVTDNDFYVEKVVLK